MSDDHNEAMRLADSIHEMNNAAYMTAIANLRAERDTLRAEVERQTSALKVIYTWAGIPGALKPENVRELSGKALGKATP